MGIFDRSRSSTSSTENVTNQPISVEGDGIAAAGVGGDVTIISTDQNAFDDARQLAERSIDFADNVARDAATLSLEQTRTIADYGTRSQENVIGAARDFAVGFRETLGGITERALSFVRGTTESQQKSLGETVTALNVIARESSKSTDERVAEVSAKAQNTVLYAVLAIAGAIAIYAMVKK